MLQYLLNTTAIWLLSLIIFDVLLRKEAFHDYNRAYLLFTFLLGILMPYWSWNWEIVKHAPTRIMHPVYEAETIKRTIAAQANKATAVHIQHASVNWPAIIWMVYFSGLFIAVVLFAIELGKLAVFFKGSRSYEDGWTVIETGGRHAPCSLFRYLFVGCRQQYNMQEWATIVNHEQRHSGLLHFADVLLLQIARIAFWFHPLIYVYEKRLLLVHEYQADSVCGEKAKDYGAFLVEQTMLHQGSKVSHSFTRSSIGKRIAMLDKRFSNFKLLKLAVIVPLLLCSMLCFTSAVFPGDRQIKDTRIFYKGNVFEESFADTTIVTNGNLNNALDKGYHFNWVIKMNEQLVYRYSPDKDQGTKSFSSAANTVAGNAEAHIYNIIVDSAATLFSHLDDGDYEYPICNVVVNTKGHVVYYENYEMFTQMFESVEAYYGAPKHCLPVSVDRATLSGFLKGYAYKEASIKPELKKLIDKRINNLLEHMPEMGRVYKNGEAIPYVLPYMRCSFKIRRHHFIPVYNFNN